MSTIGIEIKYGDVAPEAKENFVPSASESEFGEKFKQELMQYDLVFPNYGNPCEMYSVPLDGTASALPDDIENVNLGLWSEQISNEDGLFTEPIVLELTSEKQYSSQGLTFTFDEYNNIYCTRLYIQWLRTINGETSVIAEQEFNPTSSVFFCAKLVENYNKVVVTFYSLNMPKNRLKLRAIDYGYMTSFFGDELRNVKIIQGIDPLSSQISINTADFILDSKRDTEFLFQVKQPLLIYFNGALKATTFVKSAKRKARFLWDIKSEDYVGIMDGIPFPGDVYNGKNAYELFEEIFTVAKVPYVINENLNDVTVYGYIPFTTCRDALMQVAFAVQNIVDTTNGQKVEIVELEDDIKQTVPLDRIMQGQNFVTEEKITGVEIIAHAYKQIDDEIEVYDAEQSGTGQNIFVKFPEPIYDLSIQDGEIVTQGTNYAIINANVGCLLKGKRYEHTMQIYRKSNPVVLAAEIEKIVSIENATLVSTHNIDAILANCYDWYTKNKLVNLKIVEGKHIETINGNTQVVYDEQIALGQTIAAETEYLGIVTGKIIKQQYNLNGNIIVKEAVLR